MSLRKKLAATTGASAFAHLFGGRGRASEEEEKPAAETTPEDPDAEDPEEEDEDGPDAENPNEERGAEEDPDEEVAEARGAAAERARCRAIFAAPEAAGNVALAAHLAFDTDQTAAQAVATLKLGGKSSAGGLGARMAAAPNPSLGSDRGARAGAGTPEAAAASITAAYRKATGKAS